MPRRLSEQKWQALIEGIDQGLSCREAAARVGVSVATAIRWTKRSGRVSQAGRRFPLRAPEGEPASLARSRHVASKQEEKARRREALFAALGRGLSRRQAAAETGLSVATAIRWAREAAFPAVERPRVDPQQASAARDALRAGMSKEEAAQAFGLRRATVARLARGRMDAARAQKRERLFEALRAGLSCRKAAVEADLPVATAIRWARGADLRR